VVLELNGHADLPRIVEYFCDQHQSPVGTLRKMIWIKVRFRAADRLAPS
jgi:hypothetical protein